MSNGYIFTSPLNKVSQDPSWMTCQSRRENFQGYQIVVHTWHGLIFHSNYCIPTTETLDHNHAALHPKKIKLRLGYTNFIRNTSFEIYNPKKSSMFDANRIFITIPGTKLIYYALPIFLPRAWERRRNTGSIGSKGAQLKKQGP